MLGFFFFGGDEIHFLVTISVGLIGIAELCGISIGSFPSVTWLF